MGGGPWLGPGRGLVAMTVFKDAGLFNQVLWSGRHARQKAYIASKLCHRPCIADKQFRIGQDIASTLSQSACRSPCN